MVFMSANIGIISLFCKQMREKRGFSADLSSRKNEEDEASPPTPPRRGRGVICSLIIFYLNSIFKAFYSPPSSGRGWGRGFFFSLFLGEGLGVRLFPILFSFVWG